MSEQMTLRAALERLAVLDNTARGWDFHYTSCGIFNQGLFTTRKAKDDPTRICTCGRDQAIQIVLDSSVGRELVAAGQRRSSDAAHLLAAASESATDYAVMADDYTTLSAWDFDQKYGDGWLDRHHEGLSAEFERRRVPADV